MREIITQLQPGREGGRQGSGERGGERAGGQRGRGVGAAEIGEVGARQQGRMKDHQKGWWGGGDSHNQKEANPWGSWRLAERDMGTVRQLAVGQTATSFSSPLFPFPAAWSSPHCPPPACPLVPGQRSPVHRE